MKRAFVIVMLLLAAAPAVAKDPPGKVEFARATRFFAAGEFEAALPFFEKAYELSGKRPSTMLALAQCYRVLKQYDDALKYYREYLATDPPDAEKIKETIKLTEELRVTTPADEPVAKPPPERPPPNEPQPQPSLQVVAPAVVAPPPEEPSFFASPLFWIIAGGVAAAGAGIGLGFALRPEPEIYGGTTGTIARPGNM